MKTPSMTLRRWYGSSVRIPSYNEWNFIPFTATCMGLVNSVMRKRFGYNLTVQFNSIPTAAADQDNLVIQINDQFLEGNFGRSQSELVETSIAAIMGLIVHEAGHFAYSPKDLEPFVQHVRLHTRCPLVESIASSLGNIIEDMYIESEIRRTVPHLAWTLDTISGIVFGDTNVQERVTAVIDQVSAPVDEQELVNVINLLILSKVETNLNLTPWMQETFDLVLSAADLVSIDDRFDLTLAVYERIMSDMKQCKRSEKVEFSNLKGQLVSASFGDAANQLRTDSLGLSSEHDNDVIPVVSLKGASLAIADPINKAYEKMKDSLVTLSDLPDDGSGMECSIFVEHPVPAESPLEMDVRYSELAEFARQQATHNRPYGLQRSRGHAMRQLYRIATDSRIFSEPVEMNTFKPMQVLIALDCSASMKYIPTLVQGTHRTRLASASRAALGAAYGLSEAQCEVAVYGYTAEVDHMHEADLLTFKEFHEPFSVLPPRLGWRATNNDLSLNSRDGFSHLYLSKKMTASARRRLMLVISDGRPEAPGYKGAPSRQHTKKCVDQIREQGIDVLCISIAQDAFEPNNEIYGKENNVCNEDPNVIADIVRKLIAQ